MTTLSTKVNILFSFAFSILFVTSIFSQALAQANIDTEIVPGKRIGKIQIGLTVSQVRKLLGKPTGGDAALGTWWDDWRQYSKRNYEETEVRYNLSSDEDVHHRVTQILVTSPVFHTVEGISTNSSMKAIRTAYPHLKYIQLLTDNSTPPMEIYDDRAKGIAFQILRKRSGASYVRTCYAIIVHTRGEEFDGMGTDTYPMSGYGKHKDR